MFFKHDQNQHQTFCYVTVFHITGEITPEDMTDMLREPGGLALVIDRNFFCNERRADADALNIIEDNLEHLPLQLKNLLKDEYKSTYNSDTKITREMLRDNSFWTLKFDSNARAIYYDNFNPRNISEYLCKNIISATNNSRTITIDAKQAQQENKLR